MIFDATLPNSPGPPLLPAQGFVLSDTTVPFGLAGTMMVVQGLCLSAGARNGFFATTPAHVIHFM